MLFVMLSIMSVIDTAADPADTIAAVACVSFRPVAREPADAYDTSLVEPVVADRIMNLFAIDSHSTETLLAPIPVSISSAMSEKLVAEERSIEALVTEMPSTVRVIVPAGIAFRLDKVTPFRLPDRRYPATGTVTNRYISNSPGMTDELS